MELSGETMGVLWHVTVNHTPLGKEELEHTLNAVIHEVDARMSTYKEDSEVSRFAQAPAEKDFPVSADTAFVVEEALRISHLTAGAFDPTVQPLVQIWGFGPGSTPPHAPSPEQVEATRMHCGYTKLEVRPGPALRKAIPQLRLDLSAIAKGFGVDVLCSKLDELGIQNYLVEVGGELRTRGHAPSGGPWRIGIDHPQDMALPGSQLQAIVELENAAIATSGDYRNFHLVDGKRVSHTIDPRTGYPVEHRLTSVSILAPTCMEADAVATACMVLGTEDGLRLVERMDGIEGYFLLHQEGKILSRKSPGFPALQLP